MDDDKYYELLKTLAVCAMITSCCYFMTHCSWTGVQAAL